MTGLRSQRFGALVLRKYAPFVRQRFKQSLKSVKFYADVELLRDLTNYRLEPHSDHPNKVAVLLFYLPATADRPHLGTSIYVPKDPAFHCAGGPHHPQHWFTRVAIMEYRPNSVFGFCKSSISFHGVEPITESDVQRDPIQVNIKCLARTEP